MKIFRMKESLNHLSQSDGNIAKKNTIIEKQNKTKFTENLCCKGLLTAPPNICIYVLKYTC